MKSSANDVNGVKQKTLSEFELLTPKEAAQFLRMSVSFLAKARMRGTGPAFIQIGRAVRYSRAALETYKSLQTRISTSQQQMLSRSAPRTYREGGLNS